MSSNTKSRYSKITPFSFPSMGRSERFPRRVSTVFPQIPIKDLKPNMKKSSFTILFSSILCIILSLHQNSAYSLSNHNPSKIQLSERITISILSLLQILTLGHYWSLRVKMNEAYNKSYCHKGIISGNNNKKLVLFEFFISGISYPYSYNEVIYNNEGTILTLDDIITILMLLRIHFLFKFLYDISYYNSNRAQWVTNLTNVNNIMIFTLKSYLHVKSLVITLSGLILSILLFGIIIYIVERNENKLVKNLSDSLFLVIVTETTVGFGDILPSNFISKAICIFSCFSGVFLIALLTIAVHNSIDLNEKESEVYNVIKYSIDSKVLKKQAAKLIQAWWRLQLMRKIKQSSFKMVVQCYLYAKLFKIQRIQIKSMQNSSIQNNIDEVETASKGNILEFVKELGLVDRYSQDSLRCVKNEMKISDKALIFKNKCRDLLFMFDKNHKSEMELNLKSYNSNLRYLNSATQNKKKKDKAVKRMLMKYSQESALASPICKTPNISDNRNSN